MTPLLVKESPKQDRPLVVRSGQLRGGVRHGGRGGDGHSPSFLSAAAAFLQRWLRLITVLFGGGDATPPPLYFVYILHQNFKQREFRIEINYF
ncbi:hypothetical protein Scep_028314 [Stephania cephalantha]|uniref:Uncharacterized protein n=1 Tax=Stephania cephalantha TaxID=152367 RepID=A0AAP0HLP8_9MAGN